MNAESNRIANAEEAKTEIEVTPEMMRAGLAAYRREGGSIGEFINENDMVTSIFREMLLAWRSGPESGT